MWKQMKAAWVGRAHRIQDRHGVADGQVQVTKAEMQRLFAQELALLPQRRAKVERAQRAQA